MRTLEAFHAGVRANRRAGQYWLDRLSALDVSDFSGILDSTPDDFISSAAREFACEMLRVNRNGLLSMGSS
jgi:hypothetical protein